MCVYSGIYFLLVEYEKAFTDLKMLHHPGSNGSNLPPYCSSTGCFPVLLRRKEESVY